MKAVLVHFCLALQSCTNPWVGFVGWSDGSVYTQASSMSKVLLEIPQEGLGMGSAESSHVTGNHSVVSPGGSVMAAQATSPLFRLHPVSPNGFAFGMFEDSVMTMHTVGSGTMHVRLSYLCCDQSHRSVSFPMKNGSCHLYFKNFWSLSSLC